MKKLISILLLAALLLTGCSSGTEPAAPQTQDSVAQPETQEPEQAEPSTEDAGTSADAQTTEPAEPEEPAREEPEESLLEEPVSYEFPAVTEFHAGCARAEIMPEASVPLAGYGNTSMRMSIDELDTLYATCIALTDEENTTLLMYTFDGIRASSKIVTPVREKVSELLGIPQDHIMISATHTHSAPDTDNSVEPSIPPYIELVIDRMVQIAVEAMQDRAPAQMQVGSIETEGLNFVRHYLLENGTYAGDNFGDFNSSPIKDHATPVDPTMFLLRFTRETTGDIVLCNWRAHPTRTGGSTKYNISADYITFLRSYVERKHDCTFAFFQGAAGNVNPRSRRNEKANNFTYAEYGTKLGMFANDCLNENMVAVETGPIRITQNIFEAPVNHDTDSLFVAAKSVQKVWNQTNNYSKAVAAGRTSDIRSPYQANAIITRARMPQTWTLEINAFSIGDVAFVTAPNELFDTNAVYVEEHSPFGTTFTLSCTNGSEGYIPSQIAYDYTCYESDVGRYKAGTGELLADTMLEMLQTLAAS